MRYSLLNFIACPETKSELACIVTREKHAVIGHIKMSACNRINQPGSIVGPVPASAPNTRVTDVLRRDACEPAQESRNFEVRIEQGLLIALDTGRWYPIRDFIPELLPDHLRDLDRDREFLLSLQPVLPPALFELLQEQSFPNTSRRNTDAGISFKNAEMTLKEKVDDPNFFGPGYLSPFNPGSSEHTIHLIRMFGFCMPLLGNGSRRVILDAGCGYSWTTDWMWKSGMEPIGVDISRIYLDIANARLGDQLPYVLVGDTENLPIRNEVLDGVLGFDAFHHISNRNRAMHEFSRTMKMNGVIVLAEPSTAHDNVAEVQEVAKKFGTLEKGMDFKDVRKYVKGTGLAPPVQHHILNVGNDAIGVKVSSEFLRERSFNPANLFTIEKRERESIFSRMRQAVSGSLS